MLVYVHAGGTVFITTKFRVTWQGDHVVYAGRTRVDRLAVLPEPGFRLVAPE